MKDSLKQVKSGNKNEDKLPAQEFFHGIDFGTSLEPVTLLLCHLDTVQRGNHGLPESNLP